MAALLSRSQDKFSETLMDGDLWDWPYDQGFSFSDAYESPYSVESGWQADFYFGNGKDIIEENAMNEKYCVQVLKILIRKAAAEIEHLEEDLLLLQCDLAWTESRNHFEACCNALREKIDALQNSIKSLIQSQKIDTDDQLPLHRQPAEKLCKILKPFLGEGREQDDGQDQHATVNSQSIDTSMQLVSPFCETSSISGMKVESEEMEVDSIPNGSVQKHKENVSICKKEVKPEIAADGVCSNVLVSGKNGCLKPDNLTSVSKVKIEEATECCIINPCKSKQLKSASNLVGECGLLKAQKHGNSVAEKANPHVPRQSDGFSGYKKPFDPNSSSPAHAKSANCNIEDKLIDFVLRKNKNKSVTGPILPESSGVASSCLTSNTKGNMDRDLQASETRKLGMFDTSNFPIMLLPELQDQLGNDMVRIQTKETDSQNVENVSHKKSHLNVGSKPKAFTEKRRSKSHNSISKAKRHRKPGAIGDNACLDLPLDEQKPRVNSVEPCQLMAKMQVGALDIEKNLGPLSQNKGTSKRLVGRQEFIDLSSVDDVSSSDQIKLNSKTGEDKQIAKSRSTSDGHIAEILALLPSSKHELTNLNLMELRMIAKSFEMTKYHKLRKEVLLDLLLVRCETRTA